MKIVTVVGARPEFIQTSRVSKTIRQRNHTEILVHTGQHYDDNMSDVFFSDLEIPRPEINLGVGSGSHAEQTGAIMIRLENVLTAEKPDWVLVYGDTNSTVAAALVAAKMHIRLAHIEAGLRSFDKTMPEEVNRVVTDHLSDLLFAPTTTAVDNLKKEGITKGVKTVGDVRVDVLIDASKIVQSRNPKILQTAGVAGGHPFALATIHRPVNTDTVENLTNIVNAFNTLDIPVVLPVHPRLGKMMAQFGLSFGENVHTIEPVGFLDIIALLNACQIVITDSGGLQKEAYILYRPTVTVRETTEWVETIEAGWNRLSETNPTAIKSAVESARQIPPTEHPDFYGTYGVSQRICEVFEAETT